VRSEAGDRVFGYVHYFLEEKIMAQVSESSASASDALSSLQTRRSSPIRKEAEENTGSKRVVTQEQAKEAQQVSREEDKVRISQEAQDSSRSSRVDAGTSYGESLRPEKEEIENERGSAQKLKDLQNSNARGVRDFDEAAVQVETEDPSGNSSNGVDENKSNRVKPGGAEENSKIIEQQASDRKNPEVQLREFQTKNEVRIEPQVVSESVDEIEHQREKAEAAKEPALEPPSQRIIQSDSSSGSESASSAGNNVSNEQEGSKKEPTNPVSAQTETGQNIDDLI
jgi:hypothetical protein